MPKETSKLFGTDGIRGEAGKFPLDSPTIQVVGKSLARRLAERLGGRTPSIVVGRDTRESGPWLERDLIVGARGAGALVQSAGVITTPGVAFLTRALQADAGVVVSASHNPYQDNGIKIFDPSGRKLDEAMERLIEEDIDQRDGTFTDSQLKEPEASALRARYLDYLADDIAGNLSLARLKMVVDCANGAAYELAPELLRRLGARVVAINIDPDGRNINRDCGSLHLEALQQKVVKEEADLGVAFDGDADRALFVDHLGGLADGDATMWVMANYLKARGQLIGDRVVGTVMSNLGLEVALQSRGIALTRTSVGDKYVLEELIQTGGAIGGEQSGHIIFPQLSLAGDGMITTLQLLRAMSDEGRRLNEMTQGFERYPQVLVNVRVRERRSFDEFPKISSLVRKVETELGDHGRLLLRYSGTEPLARVMIEGRNAVQVRTQAEALASVIRQELGADAI